MAHRRGKDLYDAVDINDIDRVNELLEKNTYMYYENSRNGRITCMDLACASGNIRIVKLLVKKGYDINRKNKEGATPLFYALFSERDQKRRCFNYLILNKADLNIRDENGMSVLHLAIMHNKYSDIITLLDNGANIDTPYSPFNFHVISLPLRFGNYLDIYPLFMVQNYWLFQNVILNINDIDVIRKRLRAYIKQISARIDCSIKIIPELTQLIDARIREKPNDMSIFKRIILMEKNKEQYINNVQNYSTYNENIIYNISMINLLKIAISEATEYTIIACKEARMKSKKRDMRLKEYAAIRCIGKIGELKCKLQYYEQKYKETLACMKDRRDFIVKIAKDSDAKCAQLIQQIQR